MAKISSVFTREVRKWIYGVGLVAMPLLVYYGVIEGAAAPLWIAALGGVFVPGLALANLTPKVEDSDEPAA